MHQAPEKFLAALAKLGAAWQSQSHFNPKYMFFFCGSVGNLVVASALAFMAWFAQVCQVPVTVGTS